MRVELDAVETELAEAVGKARDAYARSKGWGTRYGIVGSGRTTADNHILGVQAELAVARVLGLPWKPNVAGHDGSDWGRDVEVRSRRLRLPEHAWQTDLVRGGCLQLARRDLKKRGSLYVLAHRYAVEAPGVIYLMGWARGTEVIRRKWWAPDPRTGGDGFCTLPHSELRPIPSLIQHLKEREDERRRHDIERHHRTYCGSADRR